MAKIIFTSNNLVGLFWPSEPVHLATRDNPEALCSYEPPPEFPPPIHLSAAPQSRICEYCWFIATSTGGDAQE